MPEIKTVPHLPPPVLSLKDTTLVPSVFRDHSLPAVHAKPLIHLTGYDYMVALVLFVSFCVFVWLYVANAKRLNLLIRGFYMSRGGNPLSREEYSASGRVGFLLSLLFLFTISLFAGQVAGYYGIISGREPAVYIVIVVALIAMYLLKSLTITLSGFIFKTGKEAAEYLSALLIFVNLLGVFMLPVVICLEFAKQVNPAVFIYTGFFFIAGFLCMRLLKGLVIGFSSNRVSKFYLFLYLCTLEIMPFIILVKLFMLYIA